MAQIVVWVIRFSISSANARGKALFQAVIPEEMVTGCVSFGVVFFHVVLRCRPDQGRDTCRNSANASIVSQRFRYQRRFYLRPKFRQLQRLLGPAYPKSATPKRVSEGFSLSLAHASGCQNEPESKADLPSAFAQVLGRAGGCQVSCRPKDLFPSFVVAP